MEFSLAWNTMFTDNWNVLVSNLLEMKNVLFLSQKVDWNMLFTNYWKFLVLIFSKMGNTVYYWAIKLMETWYLLVNESSSFELFGDGKYGLFLSQGIDEKIIFTWPFWAFHDTPGYRKYNFSCSVRNKTSGYFTWIMPNSL